MTAALYVAAPDLDAEWAVAYGSDGQVIVLVRDDAARAEVVELAEAVYECLGRRTA